VDALDQVARKHNLSVLFDAAHAFGCSHRGKMIGNFGRAEVFSFHATKFINSFEGGAIVTNEDELAKKIRLMTNFGFSGYDHVIYVGTNGKMNEVSAAMGLTSLESLNEFVAVNGRNYRQYREELTGVPGISVAQYDDADKCNFQYVVLEVDPSTAGLTRDQLKDVLWAENVLTRRYFFPGCHRMEPYRSNFPHSGLLLPETERLSQRILLLPTGTGVSPEAISRICEIIRLALQKGPEVRRHLEGGGAGHA